MIGCLRHQLPPLYTSCFKVTLRSRTGVRSRLQTTRKLKLGNAWQMHIADALGPHVLPKQTTANLELFLKPRKRVVTVPTQSISYWLSEFHLKNLL